VGYEGQMTNDKHEMTKERMCAFNFESEGKNSKVTSLPGRFRFQGRGEGWLVLDG